MEEIILRRLEQLRDIGVRELRRVSPSSPWFSSPWFGAWAALTTFVTMTAIPDPFGSSGEEAGVLAVIFAAAGSLAGFLMRRRVSTAVRQQRWRLATLGIGVAFLTLEGVVGAFITLALLMGPSFEILKALMMALIVAPALCLPLLLVSGTLSGLGLGAVAWLLERYGLRPATGR